MTGAELLSYIRTDVLRDAAIPYLWTDALIYRRLTKAQELHARHTYSIVDDIQTITTVAGVPTYVLPDGTLHVFSARVSTQSHDMGSHTRKAIPNHLVSSTGAPSIYTLDEATGLIRLYPTPDAVYTINLRIARLPAADVVSYAAPEIPVRYHHDLASYVAWQCLQDNDADGSGVKASSRHEIDWLTALSDAKREFYRLQLGVNPSAVSSWTGKRN